MHVTVTGYAHGCNIRYTPSSDMCTCSSDIGYMILNSSNMYTHGSNIGYTPSNDMYTPSSGIWYISSIDVQTAVI